MTWEDPRDSDSACGMNDQLLGNTFSATNSRHKSSSVLDQCFLLGLEKIMCLCKRECAGTYCLAGEPLRLVGQRQIH